MFLIPMKFRYFQIAHNKLIKPIWKPWQNVLLTDYIDATAFIYGHTNLKFRFFHLKSKFIFSLNNL